jgi:hypothetical protein
MRLIFEMFTQLSQDNYRIFRYSFACDFFLVRSEIVTRRTVPIIFSMMLVQARERRNSGADQRKIQFVAVMERYCQLGRRTQHATPLAVPSPLKTVTE